MRNLRSYFEVIFDTPEISDDTLRKFAEAHLRRLAANNPDGDFTPLITALAEACNACFGSIADRDTRLAMQKSLTATMNATAGEFRNAVCRREGSLRSEFGENAPEYAEFFPRGLAEYTEASLADVQTLMDRIVTLAITHVSRTGQGLVEEFMVLRDSFVAAHIAELEVMNEAPADREETCAARNVVEDQLMDNLLTLAIHFKRDPIAGMAYFDQSIIYSEGESDSKQ